MARLTRRTFLKNTLAAAATVTIAGTKSSGRVLGANDTIRVGVAGLNGRGGVARRRVRRHEERRDHLPRRPRHADLREARQDQIEQARRQRAADRAGHPQGARRQGTSTPSRSPRRTTGTR